MEHTNYFFYADINTVREEINTTKKNKDLLEASKVLGLEVEAGKGKKR
jgi:hypothetical protein